MTTNWSGEDVVCEHREVKATAAAIDSSGRFLLLSGRLATSIIDLQNPQVVLKRISRKSRWEVGVAAWNYHYDYKHLIAVGSNQRVDILNFEYVTSDLVDNGHSIKGLTRTILDLDWNNSDPGLIVTCSVDNYVNIWDYKDLRKPVASLPSVCGASQAKWSKTGKNFLATAHEADCKIWDFRKASTPVEYISAHSSKVNGIDWNPNNANQLVTCAQDHYVKVWDITALKRPEIVIPVTAPVWRARFAPFGEALVTIGIPQLHRGDTKLSVWALNDVISPLHQFSGHTEGVCDFFWRPLRYNEYQLVSWSKDQTLRLWKTDSSIQKQCGAAYLNHTIVLDYHHHDFPENTSRGKENNYPSSMASSSMFSADGISPPSSAVSPLDRELRSIDITNVTIEDVDLKLRTCNINVTAGQHLVKLHLSFPLGYPEISVPSFQINTETTLNANALKQLAHSIKATFERCLKNQTVSVVAAIRTIFQFLATVSADTSPSPRLETHPAFISPPTPSPKPAVSPWVNPPPSASRYSAQRTQESPLISAATAKLFGKPGVTTSFQSDTVIPFPRIAGACFAGDMLVMWSDAWKLGMTSSNARLMLDRGLSGVFPSELSIRQRQVRRQLKKKGKAEKSSIIVFRVDGLLSVHPMLAAGYLSDCMNPTRSFLFNADLAEKYDRRDLAHVWRLLAVVLRTANYPGYSLPSSDADEAPWALHPFGRKLVNHVINYFRENYDSSFLATLLCILGRCGPQAPPAPPVSPMLPDRLPPLMSRGTKSASLLGLSPKMGSSRGDEAVDMWLQTKEPGHLRSNSWSFSAEEKTPTFKRISDEYIRDCPDQYLLDPERKQEFDLYKKEYCDLLHSFQLLNKRAEIAKCLGSPPEPHKGVEFFSVCHNCNCDNRGSRCFRCNVIAVSCSICRFPVRGLSTFCFACGHGGHLDHMQSWFEAKTLCPTGCGCSCLEALKLC